jgi:microcystin-dependent protein
MSEPFMGEIRLFSFAAAPRGWMLCNGQILSIAQNQALFSILGTTYGGNGVTTFALPNLQARAPVHPSNTDPQGSVLGQSTMTLTASQIPTHTHFFMASNAVADKGATAGSVLASPQSQPIYGAPTNPVTLNAAVSVAGQNQPYDNEQPYLVINYCIAVQGIYPTRD